MYVDETESFFNFLASLLFLIGVILAFDYFDELCTKYKPIFVAVIESLFTLTFLYTVVYSLLCITCISLCYHIIIDDVNIYNVIFAFCMLLLEYIIEMFFVIKRNENM